MKKSDILDMPTIGYWSCFGGVEVKYMKHSINDYCFCISGSFTSHKKPHRVKIYQRNDSPYIILYGVRLKFNECLRA